MKAGGVGSVGVGCVLLLGACAVPSYQPLRHRVGTFPDDAFDRALQAVSVCYPRLAVIDRTGFRIQSAWTRTEHFGRTGEQRASLYRDGDELAVIVEMRYLSVSLGGTARWSTAHGLPDVERQLMQAVMEALAAPDDDSG